MGTNFYPRKMATIYLLIKQRLSRQFGWGFGGSGITEELWAWIEATVPPGRNVVEFGAGFISTRLLSGRYQLTSVEQNDRYVGLYRANYIHAPIDERTNWYSLGAQQLPKRYDLLLVDGPSGEGNRRGLLDNLDLIDQNCFVIIDDTWRDAERQLAIDLAMALERKLEDHEHFCVLPPLAVEPS